MARNGYIEERVARQELCDYARDIWLRGLSAAADGNLSVRATCRGVRSAAGSRPVSWRYMSRRTAVATMCAL